MADQQTGRLILTVLLAAPLVLAAAPPERLAEALSAQRELVAAQPGDAGALNDLGNLLVESGDLEAAEEVYRQAMAADPLRAEPQFNLALLLQASDRPQLARNQLEALLSQHPDHAWGHYQLGMLHAERGRRSRALDSYREALRLDPSLADPQVNPHIIDNSMATEAILKAFDQLAAETMPPRLYSDPSRITRLLLPRLTEQPGEPLAAGENGAEETAEPAADESRPSPP